MTRGDTINNLNMIRFAFVEAETKEQRKIIDDTFDMAIEALEQEPCEDAISREPFTDSTICEGFSCDECSFNRKDKGGCILEERVMNLPSAKQEPKTIQEMQAESEKYQKAFEDGYEQGYAQARFDYEQEPCEDAISRKEVLNQIFYSTDNSGDVVLGSVLRRRIENLPSVKPQKLCTNCQVEEKTGHWVAQDIHNCHTDFKCSECGYIHSFMHLYSKPTADYTYCPNCGTKMRGD